MVIDPIIGFVPTMLIGAAFLLPVLSLIIKRKVFYDIYVSLFMFLAMILTWKSFIAASLKGIIAVYPFGGWPPPIGILYEVDAFSGVLGVLTTSIMFLIGLYSIWYTADHRGYVWYYTLLLGLEGGMIGCLYTGDAFNLFVMIEVLSVSAYGLVAYYRSRIMSIEAAIKYAFIGAMATTMYFVALVFIYGSYGTLNMADIAIRARTYGIMTIWNNSLGSLIYQQKYILAIGAMVATILALWAFTYKAALFPNHFWLPDAHPEAPSPISAALSGLVVSIGVYAVIRWLYTIFGPGSLLDNILIYSISARDIFLYILMVLGVISAIIGSLLMTVQKDVKRLLAYSTISHIGLMFMGISIGLSNVPDYVRVFALAAVTFHLINHATGKSLLFLSSGILIKISGTRNMDKWNGIGKKSPLSAALLIMGAFNLLGVPPLGGFFSKLMLFQSFILGNMFWLAIVLIIESVISMTAYIKLVMKTVYGEPNISTSLQGGFSAKTSILILGVICVLLGILYLTGCIPVNLQKLINYSLSDKGINNYIYAAKKLVEIFMK